jgi:hypothetical protein
MRLHAVLALQAAPFGAFDARAEVAYNPGDSRSMENIRA